ncbi:MAG: hypothetical protein JNM10_17450 [Planctomycetia bacterium]|nr:hypothetical protein [Planctomycetia bacterium]
MVRPVLVALVTAAVLAALGIGTMAAARAMGDCERKVPPEADRVFERVASAFRKRQATGVSEAVDPSKGGRVYLSLAGIDAGSYTREQAAELLAGTYFADRTVVSLQQAEGCTTGDDTRLTRTYRLTTQAGGKTVDGTLTLTLHKKKIDDKTSAWFLGSLKDV